MKYTASRIRLLSICALTFIASTAFGGDSNGADYSLAALNEMKGPQLVEQYEAKLSESPENSGYRSNLALLYALSSVLDRSLDPVEVDRRKEEAVKLIEPEFRKELSRTTPDKVDVLQTGFILAQIYLTLSDIGKCEGVFSSIATRFPGDPDVEAALAHAKIELQSRIERGYPHDVLNPWGQAQQRKEELESEEPGSALEY